MDNFQSIEKELLPLLRKAEKLRKPYRFFKLTIFFFIQAVLLGAILAPFFLYLFNLEFTKWIANISQSRYFSYLTFTSLLLYWLAFFICMMLFLIVRVKHQKVEKSIIKKLIHKIAPNFQFDERKQVSMKEIKKSELVVIPRKKKKKSQSTIYNLKQGLLTGRIDDTTIQIGNIKIITQKSIYTYLYGIPLLNFVYLAYTYIRPWFTKKTVMQMGSNFLGMFVVADFNKKFSGTTVVLPDQFEKSIGYLAKTFQSLNFKRDQLVSLENPKFENEFVVYSTNQIAARYILSTTFMERILALKQKINRPIMLSFKSNKLYMAVQHPYGFFSLPENKNLITSNALEEFYRDISTAIGIVEDLNLNTRIWG